jgi:PAS domain S-box-containing protein
MSTPAPSWRPKSPTILNYGIAVLAAVAAIVVEVAVNRLWGINPTVSLFLCVTMFVAWISGTGPALLATALTVLAFDYFLLEPIYSFAIEVKDIPRFVLFAVAALFIVWLSAAQRRAAASLERARDEQRETVKQLQALNATLRIENAERRRAEERTRLAEQELQATIDTIPALAARHRADGMIDFVNQNWRNYTGLSQESWKDRGSIVTHPEDRSPVDDAWLAALAAGQSFETEQRLRRADGEYRRHVIRRVPLRNASGDVIAWYGAGYDIEDRKRAEDALRRSEADLANARHELQLIIDTVPVLVLRHRADGIIDYVNQVGRSYSGIVTTNWARRTSVITHPEDVQKIEEAWDVALATSEPFETEARLRRADGEYRWFATRRVPLRNDDGNVIAWYAATYDIEDRKRAEDALRRSEAYSAEAQKLSQTGSLAWDLVNDVHFWSDETYQIMGFDRSAKPSMDIIMQRVHPDDRAHLHHEAKRARLGAQNFDYEQRLLMPDGQVKYVHLRAHRVRYDSGKEEIVGALMDITEARKSQEALHAARTALAHASRVTMLGEISATIAHEVNQPLAAIIANGQACLRFLRRETPDLDAVRGAMEWIVKDGNRASQVIGRVRGLLKKADTEKVPLDVNEIINEVAALLQRELEAQRVKLGLELAPAIPPATADRVQLQQVIINLVMNGVDAMQAVTDRPHILLIRSSEEASQIVVAVTDSGVGIPGENAGRVFDAFYSTKPGGLGIGLSICRSIIEDHGGRLWTANDDKARGATFQFALPAHIESPPEPGQPS